MAVPEGYVALGFTGFTDTGTYSASQVYMKNDLTHWKNTVWRCLVDNTVNVEPSANPPVWEVFIEGEKPFYGAYSTFPRPGEADRFYVDDTVEPRLIYTWDQNTNDYVLTGGADGSSVDISVTLSVESWSMFTTSTPEGEIIEEPWTQTVVVPQMREGMTPLYFLASKSDDAQYAFSLITGYESGYASIKFYAADMPDTDIDIILKGIPAQELTYADNTVVFLVEPSAFTLNEEIKRYEAVVPVEGMTEGTGGTWDIVRSGPVLTEEESKIALSITDVDRLDGAVKIACLEVPAQRFMMSITGAYPDAEPGTVTLSGMQEWFERMETLEENLEKLTGLNLVVQNALSFKGTFKGDFDSLEIEPGIYGIGAAGNVQNAPIDELSYAVFIQFPYYHIQLIIDRNLLAVREYVGSPQRWYGWNQTTLSSVSSTTI